MSDNAIAPMINRIYTYVLFCLKIFCFDFWYGDSQKMLPYKQKLLGVLNNF